MIAGNVVKIAEIKNDGYGGLQYQNATVPWMAIHY